MHTCILRLVYIHSELLHVSANHLAIFRDVKYTVYVHYKYQIKLYKYRNRSIGVKLQSYEPFVSEYINISYYNKKVLIFDWMIYVEGFS